MPQRYIRLITHGVIKVDLTNPPQNFTGVASKTPTSGGVLMVAKSETKFLCLYSLGLINTDFIAPYFSMFTADYHLEFIFSAGISKEEQKFQASFSKRFKASLDNFRLLQYKSKQEFYFSSQMVGIHFNSPTTELYSTELVQSPPFVNARMAINHFNYFGSFKAASQYVDYELDLQLDGSTTPVPKLNEQGYLLWDILQRRNLNLLSVNPYINNQVKKMMLDPNQTNDIQQTLGDYDGYLKIIKDNGIKYMDACNQKFKRGEFRDSATNAEKALENFSSLHELHVLDELSLGYYNLGRALLKEKLFSDANKSLQKSKEFSERLGNSKRLAKIEGKLVTLKEAQNPALLALPGELLLRILENLSPPDIARFARTSSYSSQTVRNGLFWQRKIFNDFTKKPISETEMTFQKQYKQKYMQISKNPTHKSHSLYDSIKVGAEVWFERLMLEGAKLDNYYETIERLLKTPNADIVDIAFKYGLNTNAPIRTNSHNNTMSIFHIAVLKTPHLLPRLLKNPEKITILPRLHVAILFNDQNTLEKTLVNVEDIDQEDLCKCTALWWSIALNRTQMARRLKEKNADYRKLFKSNYCLNLLHSNLLEHLISNNKKECLELLLNWGLSPNTFLEKEGSYKSLLVIAAKCGNSDIIRLLQIYGASDKSDLDDEDVFQLRRNAGGFCEEIYPNAFCAAAENHHINSLKVFLASGIKVNSLCTIARCDHKDVDIEHNTALFFAVKSLNENTVEFLLDNKADPNRCGSHTGYEKGSCYVNEKKFTLNKLCDNLQFEDLGFSPSSYSSQNPVMKSWFKILELLLKHGADVNKSQFIIHLITAPMDFRIKESEYCIAHKSMGNAPSRQNFIIDVFEILSKYNADFNIQDGKGKSVLHYAAETGLHSVVCHLVEKLKVNINLKNSEGETAIFGAARNFHEKVYNYLKKMGIDIQPNRKEETLPQIVSASFLSRYN